MNSRHFTVETLADGVHTTLARPGGAAICNSAIVDLGPATLVFDTTLTPVAAQDVVRAATELTGRTPTVAANSHWHMDHMLGNSVFAAGRIVATRRTREILVDGRARFEADLQPEALAREFAAFSAAEPTASQEWRDLFGAFRDEAGTFRFTPPTEGFEGRYRFDGDRPAELRTWGWGHTESDAVLHLPDERVVFAGDLVMVRNHPSVGSGRPEHWLEVLSEIEALRPERVVPGHGPVASLDAVAEMREYLQTLLTEAAEPGDRPMPHRYAAWGFGESWKESIAFVRSRPGPSP